MRIGVHLPTYWQDYGATGIQTAIEETATAAQALGYVSLWANDHVIAPADQPAMGTIMEPLITLASVMHLAPRLHLGTSTLVLPQRHPVLVAKQAATLDVVSGGRFILGIGVGWLEEEFQYLGADFARRGAVTDEAIAVMRTLWREPAATFHGRYCDFSDAVFAPKPAGGSIPVWVCGNTHAAIRRAARLGDAWDPFGITLEAFTAGVAAVRALAGERTLTIAAHLRIRVGGANDGRAHLAGTAEELTLSLAAYQRAGLEYLICDFVADGLEDLLHQMRSMSEQVAPALAAT
jgi:probable F420-dependent oxidoreductase